MSANLDSREAETNESPDDTQLPAVQPDTHPPARPHDPGARPAPLPRLLYP
ncbi:hypothetical protein [Streptomyces sp. NBC_01240]|uniref:hypothetical protein n=1 Tax=Streptomyces sp. NBC_01240 TaxID=2903793 RepID=UPI002E0D28BE|nr:hypothetical protein OG466_41175 [Streptomyces sp. NBC_01240]